MTRKFPFPVLFLPVAVILVAIFRLSGLLVALGVYFVIGAVRVASRYERTPRSGDGPAPDGARGSRRGV